MNSRQIDYVTHPSLKTPEVELLSVVDLPRGNRVDFTTFFPYKPLRPLAPSSSRADVVYQLADRPQTRLGAFHLIYERYLEAGLIEANPFQLRVTPYHLQPKSVVFVGQKQDEVTCTVSLIDDAELGLPIERAYSREVERKRAEGLRLAEVSCLAFRTQQSKTRFWNSYLRLIRIMAQYARFHGVDALMIAVHPRHLACHTRLMGFEQIGPVRTYPSVRNHLAVACCLEFARVDREPPICYDAIFGQPLPARQLAYRPISPMERIWLKPVAACPGHDDLVAAVA